MIADIKYHSMSAVRYTGTDATVCSVDVAHHVNAYRCLQRKVATSSSFFNTIMLYLKHEHPLRGAAQPYAVCNRYTQVLEQLANEDCHEHTSCVGIRLFRRLLPVFSYRMLGSWLLRSKFPRRKRIPHSSTLNSQNRLRHSDNFCEHSGSLC